MISQRLDFRTAEEVSEWVLYCLEPEEWIEVVFVARKSHLKV